MELRTLRAFVEVVRQGGFTQAAKKVFATTEDNQTFVAIELGIGAS